MSVRSLPMSCATEAKQDILFDRLLRYRLHTAVGGVVLLLTVTRIAWKYFDVKPAPTSGLTGVHLRGMELVHVLFYLVLLVLGVSGIFLNVQSGFLYVLRGATQEFPDFAEFAARRAHGMLARIYIALLVSHIGGVVVHQIRHGHAFARMGIGNPDDVYSRKNWNVRTRQFNYRDTLRPDESWLEPASD